MELKLRTLLQHLDFQEVLISNHNANVIKCSISALQYFMNLKTL